MSEDRDTFYCQDCDDHHEHVEPEATIDFFKAAHDRLLMHARITGHRTAVEFHNGELWIKAAVS